MTHLITSAALLLALVAPAGAATAPTAQDYAALARLPDFGGVWYPDADPRDPPFMMLAPKTPLRPELRARLGGIKGGDQLPPGKGDSQSRACTPGGMPGEMFSPFALEFLYTPGRVTIALEYDEQVRRIYTDGRAHDPDPDLTFNGESIGRWQGDTLVVDTTGLRPANIAQNGLIPVTKPFHLTERYHLIGPNKLALDMAVDAPEVLTRPAQVHTTYTRHRDWSLREYVCEENPRDTVDANGNATINLEPTP